MVRAYKQCIMYTDYVTVWQVCEVWFYICQKIKKIKRADQILPEVYGTTLRRFVAAN
jgi:hypothetical protein